jgi:hypothetical protein
VLIEPQKFTDGRQFVGHLVQDVIGFKTWLQSFPVCREIGLAEVEPKFACDLANAGTTSLCLFSECATLNAHVPKLICRTVHGRYPSSVRYPSPTSGVLCDRALFR